MPIFEFAHVIAMCVCVCNWWILLSISIDEHITQTKWKANYGKRSEKDGFKCDRMFLKLMSARWFDHHRMLPFTNQPMAIRNFQMRRSKWQLFVFYWLTTVRAFRFSTLFIFHLSAQMPQFRSISMICGSSSCRIVQMINKMLINKNWF